MSFVSVDNLRVWFGATEVVHGVSFEIAPGECLALVGESGSGKTQTALALLGLTPDGGTARADSLVVAGRDASRFREDDWRGIRGRHIGLVSQDALVSLDPLRRVGREVAEAIEVHDREPSDIGQRVLSLLADVAVPEPAQRARQFPHELSGGLRQRALIASALAAGPALLIADEPTTALDATVQVQIIDLLATLKRQGLGLLLVSHDLGLVARLADRIAVMKDGEIVETADAASLLSSPQHPYTRMLIDAVPGAKQGSGNGASDPGEVVLSARDLVKAYRRPDHTPFRALDGVSLDLRAGTTLGVVGESGSGKSTLASLLLALERPDAGTVTLGGKPWSELSESRRRRSRARIQLIDQDPFGALDPRHSVQRIITEALSLTDTPRAERPARIVELLGQVGLSEEFRRRRPHQLSGGQRQRVAIARALARRPEILVCDEPVSALDVSVQRQVLDLLGDLQQRLGLSMVFISHDLGVIRQLADDILVLKDGVVVEQGDAASVLESPQHPFTIRLLSAMPALVR
ncbi:MULTISPECIES: ABC transporter ATP-binding protein [unclassified Diaminobutyricimonas]|uniref:dipeptide ABC transporter ATP-binding protein n=1 Tax=unclassified Diaminobutyricimonas TaxID=2643261 RepID=UPI0012F4E3FF|nr:MULTISPECIES: ABC transporter ATP-binding protein [unclassified Diaminobutyricimonas]